MADSSMEFIFDGGRWRATEGAFVLNAYDATEMLEFRVTRQTWERGQRRYRKTPFRRYK